MASSKHSSISNSNSDDDDNDINRDLISERIVNLLTDVVRKQYCTHLENLLNQNFEFWCLNNIGTYEVPPKDWIKQCVQIYEMKAIKSCMIAQFYRKSMLSIMANIRRNTQNRKLATNLKLYSESSQFYVPESFRPYKTNTGTQTAQSYDSQIKKHNNSMLNLNLIPNNAPQHSIQEYKIDTSADSDQRLSLDQRIELFKDQVLNASASEKPETRPASKRRRSSPSSPQKPYHVNVNRIKDDPTVQQHSKNILTLPAIETLACPAIVNTDKNEINSIDIDVPSEDDIAKELDKIFNDEDLDFDNIFGTSSTEDPKIDSILMEIEHAQFPTKENTPDLEQLESMKAVTNTSRIKSINNAIMQKPPTQKLSDYCLRDSIWPCELHMQTIQLREILTKTDLRFHEKIKLKFIELFGDNEDEIDDFAPYSPTLELNDVLLCSCKVRIAPWIVKYLMNFTHLIGNRMLFKKFAKSMANKIVINNQYPCEENIRDEIFEYFILNKRIDSIDDIDII